MEGGGSTLIKRKRYNFFNDSRLKLEEFNIITTLQTHLHMSVSWHKNIFLSVINVIKQAQIRHLVENATLILLHNCDIYDT